MRVRGRRAVAVAPLVLTALLIVAPSDAAATCGGMAATIVGTSEDDVVTGTTGDDVIVAGAGSDQIHGLDGDDRICGDVGSDTVSGGDGHDRLYGGHDNDVLNGDSGDDAIHGQSGDDRMDGGGGRDLLVGYAGFDTYVGGSGTDTASFWPAAQPVIVDLEDRQAFGEGQDFLDGVESATGSRHADTLVGDALVNVLTGGGGDDRIWGLGGGDSLFAGDGNDTMRGGPGDDIINGGLGTDLADYNGAPSAVTVNLATRSSSGADGRDFVANVENVTGSIYPDSLTGDSLANVLAGDGGGDTLRGGGGSDALNGGPGRDLASFADAARGVTVDLDARRATGEGADTLTSIESAGGSPWEDFLYGTAGDNGLSGGRGSDVLMGFDGADILNGDEGADTLRGGPGSDLLNGGADVDACVDGESVAACERGGGTLLVDLTSDFDYVDPALSFFPHSWQLHAMTCARLLAHPDAPLPDGARLVPDAAVALPEVSSDGRTYTFRIRSGVVFSPPSGEVVTAATFKYSIERALHPTMQSPAAGFLEDVVGFADYRAGRASGIAGVVAQGNTLSITLVAPRRDLPARLALPFFCAVPTSIPIAQQFDPIPSAGPYYLVSWARGSGAVAVRNPHYRGARDSHFDSVDWDARIPLAEQRTRVENNVRDVGTVAAADASAVYAQYGEESIAAQNARQRYFTPPQAVIWYVVLNTSRPAFADENLRKAVAYAIDRTHLASLHGFRAGTPTDQILPPGVVGFRDDDVHPLTPDPATARAYAAAAGVSPSSPITVQLYTFDAAHGPGFASHVQSALAPLGIDVNVQTFARVTQHERIATRGEPFDISIEGWGMDFNDPYNFLDTLLHGSRIRATSNTNVSYFDDPTFNARLDAASQLGGSARLAAYADLDRDLSRAAPILPYVNTNARAFFSDRIGCHVFASNGTAALNALCLR